MNKGNQMLTRILNKVTGAPAEDKQPAADVAAADEIVLMRNQADAELAAAAAALAEMTAKFDAAQAELAALVAASAQAAAQAEADRLLARKERVVAAIGTEKADGLMLATQNLDDAGFDAIVTALASSVDAEASKGLFAETGVTATADTNKIVAESPEMKILRQKFSGAK